MEVELMKSYIQSQIRESLRIHELMASQSMTDNIDKIIQVCTRAYRNKGKTIFCGNGGSAADAQHLSAEFVGRFNFDRPPLPSIALTTNTSSLTAIANDYGYNELFSRQLTAHAQPGDVLFAITTSGNSVNVLAAARRAVELGVVVVGLTGRSGGDLKQHCDYCICIPSDCTARIQEGHILVGHVVCASVEKALFSKCEFEPKKQDQLV